MLLPRRFRLRRWRCLVRIAQGLTGWAVPGIGAWRSVRGSSWRAGSRLTVVDDHGRALLIRRRDNQQWEPPGGVLELGETIHAGVCREVREEAGLAVQPVALTGVYKNMKRGIVALVFRCQMLGGHLTPNDEVSGFQWATAEEIMNMTDEAYAVRVLDALHENGTPAVRQHDGFHLL